jgi:hypothetical protein
MICYEVQVEVKIARAEEYLSWLGPHIRDVLATPGFLSAQLLEVTDLPQNSARTFKVLYWVDSEESLTDYIERRAPQLRGDAQKRFGSDSTFKRQVSKILEEFI